MSSNNLRQLVAFQLIWILAALVLSWMGQGNPAIRLFTLGAVGVGALVALAVFRPQGGLNRLCRRVFDGPWRARVTVLVIPGLCAVAAIYLILKPTYQPPNVWLPYLMLLIFWPWLLILSLRRLSASQEASRLQTLLFRIFLLIVVTEVTLEITGNLALAYLPVPVSHNVPYAARFFGINDHTDYGARQFPPHQRVMEVMDGRSGNLYGMPCLAIPDHPLFPVYTIDFTRNDKGFRTDTPWPDQPDVAVVGDSFTAGEQVPEPFWHGISPAVMGVGLPDAGNAEELDLLRKFVFPRKPKVVVMAYFEGNDITNNRVFTQAVANGKSYYDYLMENDPPIRFSVVAQGVYWAVNQLTPSNCPYPIQDTRGNSLAFPDFVFPVSMMNTQSLEQSSQYAVTRQALIDTNNETRAAGAQFVLMFVPHDAHVYWPFLSDSQIAAIGRRVLSPNTADLPLNGSVEALAAQMRANMDVQRTALAQLAAEQGFAFLDLTPVFQQATAEGASLYFYGDLHWNQAGHNLAHQTLLEFLQQQGFVPGG